MQVLAFPDLVVTDNEERLPLSRLTRATQEIAPSSAAGKDEMIAGMTLSLNHPCNLRQKKIRTDQKAPQR